MHVSISGGALFGQYGFASGEVRQRSSGPRCYQLNQCTCCGWLRHKLQTQKRRKTCEDCQRMVKRTGRLGGTLR